MALQETVQVHFQRVTGTFTADRDDFEALEVHVPHPRVVQHGRDVPGNSSNIIGLIFVEVLRPVFRVEVRDEHDRGAHGERHVHVDERTVHDKGHHQVQEHRFLLVQVEDVMVLERDRVQRVVAEHDGLREASGTTGVRKQRGRVRVLLVLDVRHSGPCGDELVPGHDDRVGQIAFVHSVISLEECPDLLKEREVVFHAEGYDFLDAHRLGGQEGLVHEDVRRDDQLRLVRPEELDEVLGGGQHVDEVHDGPNAVQRVVADDAGHAGDGQDRDDVPLLHALCEERLRGLVDAFEELSVCDLVPHVVEGIRVQVILVVFVKVLKESHVGQRVLDGLFAVIRKPGPVDARVPGPRGIGEFLDLLCGRLVQSHARSLLS